MGNQTDVVFCFQVSAGLLRPIGIPLRLDDAGRVVTECCAMGKVYTTRRRRGGDGGSHGRGGAAQWASQWWAAANDAAEVSGVNQSPPHTLLITTQLPNYHPNTNHSPP